jgi:hypothetical protein
MVWLQWGQLVFVVGVRGWVGVKVKAVMEQGKGVGVGRVGGVGGERVEGRGQRVGRGDLSLKY